MSPYLVGLLGIVVALALLIFMAFRGFSLLLAAPAAAIRSTIRASKQRKLHPLIYIKT